MYQRSPMENYNKNNPFIIMAKRKYDDIIDTLQLFSKDCIIMSTVALILWIFMMLIQFYIIAKNIFFPNIQIKIILVLITNIAIFYSYIKKIKYFMYKHPSMQEFDRISSLEINDILALNNESILKCINSLYELYGELVAVKKYYSTLIKVYIVVEIIFVITLCISIM